jgi:hypothetical protein
LEDSSTNTQLQHTYYKFFAEDITTYRSYPLPHGWKQPKEFDMARNFANYDVPKRMISFEAKNCWIHEVPLPITEDSAAENEMEDLLEDITGCQEAGATMGFTCSFDDYRNDCESFNSIEESIEFDPFVAPTDLSQNEIMKEGQEDDVSMESPEAAEENSSERVDMTAGS